jgi:Putative polyhydroxyalkanoic acid system protein (PHA_gran_rgn)
VKFTQAHTLSRAQARTRIKRLTEHWREKYGITVSWAGDEASLSRKVKGFHLDAHLVVGDTRANGTGADPSFLVRGTVIKYLKTTLARYLDPAIPVGALEST